MFRQIRVDPAVPDLHSIVWAPRSDFPPMEYRLKTVTYGTSCAPYLIMRTLQQLAQEGKCRFRLGAGCIESNIYVDYIFAGVDALRRRKRWEVVYVLKSARIELDN
jgi:hypothetical protein